MRKILITLFFLSFLTINNFSQKPIKLKLDEQYYGIITDKNINWISTSYVKYNMTLGKKHIKINKDKYILLKSYEKEEEYGSVKLTYLILHKKTGLTYYLMFTFDEYERVYIQGSKTIIGYNVVKK